MQESYRYDITGDHTLLAMQHNTTQHNARDTCNNLTQHKEARKEGWSKGGVGGDEVRRRGVLNCEVRKNVRRRRREANDRKKNI